MLLHLQPRALLLQVQTHLLLRKLHPTPMSRLKLPGRRQEELRLPVVKKVLFLIRTRLQERLSLKKSLQQDNIHLKLQNMLMLLVSLMDMRLVHVLFAVRYRRKYFLHQVKNIHMSLQKKLSLPARKKVEKYMSAPCAEIQIQLQSLQPDTQKVLLL